MIEVIGLPHNDELLKGENRKILLNTINLAIQKLCKVYTNQSKEEFTKSYSNEEKQKYNNLIINGLCEWNDFIRDMIDFFLWGLNTTNIIGNSPRNMLALYFFNLDFTHYINETLYTSDFSLISSRGSDWNLFCLIDDLNLKLECSKDLEYTILKQKFNLWLLKRKGEIQKFNIEKLTATTDEKKIKLINNPNIAIIVDDDVAILEKKYSNGKPFRLYTINSKYEINFCTKRNYPYPDVFKYEINVESLNDCYFGGFIVDSEDK